MPEIEREGVIAQRLEELQRITDKRNLDQMLKAQKDGDGDSVAKAAKRTFPQLLPSALNLDHIHRPARRPRSDKGKVAEA
jgi:hypothetical protein